LIGHAANAKWPATQRRINESLTICFPLLAVLFIPIALALDDIYIWADPAAKLSAHDAHLVDEKRAWLAPVPFVVRAFIYLAVFFVAAEVLRRRSRIRDRVLRDPEREVIRDRVFACVMLPFVGLAVTFAAYDWVMSLQPTWYSSIFGVYYFAGGFVAALSLLAIIAWRTRYVVPQAITRNHFHALGRLMFGFTVFWAYSAYFQGFLITIANRPTEVTFYIVRSTNGWGALLWLVILVHFAVPFLMLLPRLLKLRPAYVATVACIIITGHVLDLYWVIIPSRASAASWLDLVALAGVVGACVTFAGWRQRGLPVVANEPYLEPSMAYASPT
jgi:hypothetical protein